MSNLRLPPELSELCDLHIYQTIADHGEHTLVFTCKWLYWNIKVRNLPTEAERRITKERLNCRLARDLETVTIYFGRDISLNHLASLKTLVWVDSDNFSWSRISGCTELESLIVWLCDPHPGKPPWFPKLRKLYMEGAQDITEGHFDGISLEELSVSSTGGSLNLNHTGPAKSPSMRSLTVLRATGSSTVTQETLDGMNLRELSISHNSCVTRIDHMTNLEVLDISHSLVGQDQIDRLNLKTLNVSWNERVRSVNHMGQAKPGPFGEAPRGEAPAVLKAPPPLMRKLEVLIACGTSGITDKGLEGVVSLTYLDADCNPGIAAPSLRGAKRRLALTTVNHMVNLRELHAGGSCGITDEGLGGVVSLTYLDASNNPGITRVPEGCNLRELHACRSSGITDEGLRGANLEVLYASGNPGIAAPSLRGAKRRLALTNVNHMGNLKTLVAGYNSGIGDEGLRGVVSLTYLCADDNPKITDVSHMTRLFRLYSRGKCGIRPDGLRDLDIVELVTDQHP